MKQKSYDIQCGRCGATKTEPLTDKEAEGITDRLSPAYRECEGCGKTTGWIKARKADLANEETSTAVRVASSE